MSTQPAVLVVDDEKVVCSGCDRILSDEGFQVETSTDVRRGLKMAETKDYDAILLDLRMEGMDGLEFLERLRGKKPDVPVIIITGYPSPESLERSMRMGVSDYIPKPFTPEEISKSVRMAAGWQPPVDESLPAEVAEKPAAEEAHVEAVRQITWRLVPGAPHFLDEAWLRQCEDGQVSLGAFLPRLLGTQIGAVALPRPGDAIRRGLPLAALTMGGEGSWTLPSPISGTVTAVNQALAQHPDFLWREPFRGGWIARVQPDRLGEELASLRTRRVVLACDDQSRAARLATRLANLGCDVHIRGTALADRELGDPGVLMVDASSCQEDGVRLVERVKLGFPERKVIVLGDGRSTSEAAYRASRVFYYAVEPFEDMEIADILFDAFRAFEAPDEEQTDERLLPETLSSVRIINRRGQRVSLLSEGRLLSRNQGLGLRLIDKILKGFYPIQTTRTARPTGLDRREILREAGECDLLLVLRAEDQGRVPGSVALELRDEGAATRTTTITVQPGTSKDSPLAFDVRTTEAMANFVLEMMA